MTNRGNVLEKAFRFIVLCQSTRYITVEQICGEFGCHRKTAYRYIYAAESAGMLRVEKTGFKTDGVRLYVSLMRNYR